MTTENSIGVIDSGVGGLSVVKALRNLLPYCNLVYVTDPLYFPYGEKTGEDLIKIVKPLIDFLVNEEKVQVVVTACGTISAICLPALSQMFAIPLYGILQPASERASEVTNKGKIAVLATRATTQAGSFRKAIHKINPSLQVVEEAWPELIQAVERGDFDTQKWRLWVRNKLENFRRQGVDTVVMGCTHFALISDFFREMGGDDFQVVDPSVACAQKVFDKFNNCEKSLPTAGEIQIVVRGDEKGFLQTISKFWPDFQPTRVEKISDFSPRRRRFSGFATEKS